MTEIDEVLAKIVAVVKSINVSRGPGQRVWRQPADASDIDPETYPFVIVSKLNAEPGSWQSDSYGAGKHEWSALIAVYLNPGPVIVTNTDEITIDALSEADEWYKAMADALFQNFTLDGLVSFIGNGEGQLYEYVTDNIMWNGKQHYGHLFILPITQIVVQEFDS